MDIKSSFRHRKVIFLDLITSMIDGKYQLNHITFILEEKIFTLKLYMCIGVKGVLKNI